MRNPAFIFMLFAATCFGQANSARFKADILKAEYLLKTDVKSQLTPFDIGPLLTQTNDAAILGFIGADFQRIRMRLISVIKNAAKADQYFVYGKSMVKDNVCEFQGTLTVNSAFYVKEPDEKDVKQGVIVGDYVFFENPSQKHVGQFKGVFKIGFYIDKEGKIHYDDLMGGADGFTNNEFVGTWSSYNGKLTKDCNWGDHRIPMSGELDTGAGEFFPNDKYANNGWQNYKLAYFGEQNKSAEEARKKENETWWK